MSYYVTIKSSFNCALPTLPLNPKPISPTLMWMTQCDIRYCSIKFCITMYLATGRRWYCYTRSFSKRFDALILLINNSFFYKTEIPFLRIRFRNYVCASGKSASLQTLVSNLVKNNYTLENFPLLLQNFVLKIQSVKFALPNFRETMAVVS